MLQLKDGQRLKANLHRGQLQSCKWKSLRFKQIIKATVETQEIFLVTFKAITTGMTDRGNVCFYFITLLRWSEITFISTSILRKLLYNNQSRRRAADIIKIYRGAGSAAAPVAMIRSRMTGLSLTRRISTETISQPNKTNIDDVLWNEHQELPILPSLHYISSKTNHGQK